MAENNRKGNHNRKYVCLMPEKTMIHMFNRESSIKIIRKTTYSNCKWLISKKSYSNHNNRNKNVQVIFSNNKSLLAII